MDWLWLGELSVILNLSRTILTFVLPMKKHWRPQKLLQRSRCIRTSWSEPLGYQFLEWEALWVKIWHQRGVEWWCQILSCQRFFRQSNSILLFRSVFLSIWEKRKCTDMWGFFSKPCTDTWWCYNKITCCPHGVQSNPTGRGQAKPYDL